jgi:uncharacterized damage-inducible protein DinB
MNSTDLQILLDYHYWARDRILAAAEALTAAQYLRPIVSSFGSVRDTLAHTYSAEWAWYQRFHGTSPAAGLDLTKWPDVSSLRGSWADLERDTRAYVGGQDQAGLDRIVPYKNLAGEAAALPVWQLVQHMVNHASYHRGQATTLIRQVGGQPPKSMDLVAYYKLLAARR